MAKAQAKASGERGSATRGRSGERGSATPGRSGERGSATPGRSGAGAAGERGSATVEWVIAFPTFLFLCFLVVELSMMWTDRHVLSLAAFEAARTLAIQGVDEPCKDEEALKKAERAAVFKVAMIAPSPAFFFRGLLQPSQFTGALTDAEAKIDQTMGGSRVGVALKRQVLGIPAAYALTHVECTEDADGVINMDVRYLRAPRLPFVGGALWATFVLNRINEAGIGSFLKFDLDQYYFGAKAHSPALNAFKSKYETVKSGIKDAVGGAAGLGVELKDLAGLVRSLPGGDKLGEVFGRAGDAVGHASSAVTGQVDALSGPIDDSIKTVEKAMNDHTKVLTALIYKVPASMRLIPMHAQVALRKDFADRRGDVDWTQGQALLVAPFAVDANTGAQDSQDLWHTWAKALSQPTKNIGGGE